MSASSHTRNHKYAAEYTAAMLAWLEGIEIAGIEMITDGKGQIHTYDVNTNTNYNSEAESKAGVSGIGKVKTSKIK